LNENYKGGIYTLLFIIIDNNYEKSSIISNYFHVNNIILEWKKKKKKKKGNYLLLWEINKNNIELIQSLIITPFILVLNKKKKINMEIAHY